MIDDFKIERVGDKFKIIRHSEDLQEAGFINNIYTEILRKIDITKEQLKQLPKQKEIMEKDIEILESRLEAIRPFLNDIKLLMKQDELKAKREVKKE
jgi:hypothetical protein